MQKKMDFEKFDDRTLLTQGCDWTSNSGGILIAIKEKLKTIVVEVNREDKIGKILRVLLKN